MKLRMGLAVALVVLMSVPGLAQKKKKPTLPAVFGTAKYVWVQAMDGDSYTPGLLPADRQAIGDAQNVIRDWDRYKLTDYRKDAELVIFVRKGRLASGTMGIGSGIGPGPTASPVPGGQRSGAGAGGPGVDVGGEAGPPDDYIEVRMVNADGKLSAPIWVRSQPDGLDGPRVPLLQYLKQTVEKEYPR